MVFISCSSVNRLQKSGAGVDGEEEEDDWFAPFRKRPLQVYSGHSADVLDVSWSKVSCVSNVALDKNCTLRCYGL